MAEEEEEPQEGEGGEGEASPEPEQSSRVPQFIVLIFVILVGQGAAVYYLITEVYYPGLFGEPDEVEGKAMERERPVFEIDQPMLHELGEMVMNPPDPEGIRFLSAKVTIEVDTPEALASFDDPLAAAGCRWLPLAAGGCGWQIPRRQYLTTLPLILQHNLVG